LLAHIKCPYCGQEFKQDLKKTIDDGEVIIVRSPELEVVTIDVTCPKCNAEFEPEI
jgi:protein-disulfide isomerase